MRVLLSLALVSTLALTAACNRDRKDETVGGEAPAAGAETAAPGAPALKAGPLTLSDMPRRKPGLWEISMVSAESGDQPVTTRLCLDAATEAKMGPLGDQMAAETCPTRKMDRRLDGSIAISSTCNMGSGGVVRSTGVVTGDLTSNYVLKIDSSTSGAELAQMNGERSMTISSRRVGACEPGQKGGDMTLPGGRTVNMNDMPALNGAAARP